MAQGCWSVDPVCATSYSWTTGPHRGAMESPQTAAGTRDPATPMVAVPAENGSTNLAGLRSPGIGSDGRLVQMSAKIPLRGCEPLVFRRWIANSKDCASKAKLNGLLQNRAVPTREAVVLSFPSQSDEQHMIQFKLRQIKKLVFNIFTLQESIHTEERRSRRPSECFVSSCSVRRQYIASVYLSSEASKAGSSLLEDFRTSDRDTVGRRVPGRVIL